MSGTAAILSIPVAERNEFDKEVPITLRQSNRSKANKLAKKLKSQIVEREFLLTEPSDYLDKGLGYRAAQDLIAEAE